MVNERGGDHRKSAVWFLRQVSVLRLAVSEMDKGNYTMNFFTALTRLVRDDKGSQATEIALGIVLIALVAGLGMVEFGEDLAQFFVDTGAQIDNASPGGVPTPNGPSGTD